VNLIRLVVAALCVALWAIVGLVVWIPLLLRSVLGFTLTILLANLTRWKPSAAGQALERAMSFYADGFRRIFRTFDDAPESSHTGATPDLLRFGLEMLWTAIFWGSAIWTIRNLAAPSDGAPLVANNAAPHKSATVVATGPEKAIAIAYLHELSAAIKGNNSLTTLTALERVKAYPTLDAVPILVETLKQYRGSSSNTYESRICTLSIELLDALQATQACELLVQTEVVFRGYEYSAAAGKAAARLCRQRATSGR
jgi:hypothetical protein